MRFIPHCCHLPPCRQLSLVIQMICVSSETDAFGMRGATSKFVCHSCSKHKLGGNVLFAAAVVSEHACLAKLPSVQVSKPRLFPQRFLGRTKVFDIIGDLAKRISCQFWTRLPVWTQYVLFSTKRALRAVQAGFWIGSTTFRVSFVKDLMSLVPGIEYN